MALPVSELRPLLWFDSTICSIVLSVDVREQRRSCVCPCVASFEPRRTRRSSPREEEREVSHVVQGGTDGVIAFFQVFHRSIPVENVVPAIVNEQELQFEPSTEIEEHVRLRPTPILLLQVLFVFTVGVRGHVDVLCRRESTEKTSSRRTVTLLNLAKGYSGGGSSALPLCCQW